MTMKVCRNMTFYAGAKFETHPSCVVLPSPPTHWTTPIQRSQSEPSTPTMKSSQNGIPIDVASLFGSPNPVTMAKSYPGDRKMQAFIKSKAEGKRQRQRRRKVESDSSDEELKEILSVGAKKAVLKKEDAPSDAPTVETVSTSPSSTKSLKTKSELTKALGMIMTNSSPPQNYKKFEPARSLNLSCHGSVTPLSNFKEMSDQLKTLMKVAG